MIKYVAFVYGRRSVGRYGNDEWQSAGARPATVAETSLCRTAARPNVTAYREKRLGCVTLINTYGGAPIV